MKRVVRLETSVCFRITRVMNNQTESRKRATSQKEEKAATIMLWLLRKVYHNWVVHHKIHMYSFLKVECLGETLCRSLGTNSEGTIHLSVDETSIPVKVPHQRSPYSMKFEDKSYEETERQ